MILNMQKVNNNPQNVFVKVSSATYKRSSMHTVNAGLQFMVPISLSFLHNKSFCSVLAAPSCQFRPTMFEQGKTAVK